MKSVKIGEMTLEVPIIQGGVPAILPVTVVLVSLALIIACL